MYKCAECISVKDAYRRQGKATLNGDSLFEKLMQSVKHFLPFDFILRACVIFSIIIIIINKSLRSVYILYGNILYPVSLMLVVRF